MPKAEKKLPPADARIAFLADRMAILMVDLVQRDLDYGEFCYDDFYEDEYADEVRQSDYYGVSLDFVRNMLRRHDNDGPK